MILAVCFSNVIVSWYSRFVFPVCFLKKWNWNNKSLAPQFRACRTGLQRNTWFLKVDGGFAAAKRSFFSKDLLIFFSSSSPSSSCAMSTRASCSFLLPFALSGSISDKASHLGTHLQHSLSHVALLSSIQGTCFVQALSYEVVRVAKRCSILKTVYIMKN